MIDTGFSGYITLPPSLVSELGLSFVTSSEVLLADGSAVSLDIYRVSVLWDGQVRDANAYLADSTILVGMRMLDRHNLNMDVEDGGQVMIQAIIQESS